MILGTPLPAELAVGRGDVLLLDGRAAGSQRTGVVRVSIGSVSARAIAHDVPPPGELSGSGWWRALVPLEPIEADLTAEVLVTPASGEPAVAASIRLIAAPPNPALLEGATNSRVIVCMATHEPDPGLLRAQIESIASQTCEDWTCIISDDASGTEAIEAIELAIGGDPRFMLIRNERRAGFYRNFERALAAVPPGTRFVALADQDDRWAPDKLDSLTEALERGAILAHSDARVMDRAGREISPRFWPRGLPGDDRVESLIWANTVTGASCMFRREVLDRALPFPALAGHAFHDRWIALVAASMGSIERIERPLYDYVQHEQSVQGHARAVGHQDSVPRAIARRAQGLAQRRPNWRDARETVLSRTVSEAIVLRLRLGDRLGHVELRELALAERLPHSTTSFARVAARHAVRTARRQTGLQGALLRGAAWPVLARARTRVGSTPPATRPPAAGRVREKGRRTLGLTVTSLAPDAGFGDLYTAQELGAALEARGVPVTYLELEGDRWRNQILGCRSLVSLHDRFPLTEVPRDVVAAAWVRNWTGRWIERPWFDQYDLIFASSQTSVDLISSRVGKQAGLMPLATNPARFSPSTSNEPRSGVVFAGNRWGSHRQVEDILPSLPSDLQARVSGSGWDEVPAMVKLWNGHVAYDDLPDLYAASSLVVDDSASHTRPYGSVNSRVFDAIAAGAIVASNDKAGVTEIFGQGFPVWSDAASLAAIAREAACDSAQLLDAFAGFRKEVLANHTYEARAAQVERALAAALAD